MFVFLGFVAALIGYSTLHREGFSLEKLGSFGSYLQGAVGSLWTLAGLLYIYVAFLGQKQQLIQQGLELEDQKKQFAMQQDSIKRQNFESTFFQLLNLQTQMVQEMRYGGGHRGKECFEQWHIAYEPVLRDWLKRQGHPEWPIESKGLLGSFFEEFYGPHESQMGPYFRNLGHIINFVKTSGVEPKRRYTRLVMAQLSKFEFFFLFYYGLTSYGGELKLLIEEFGLFEYLDRTLLLGLHEDFYARTAYQ